MIEIALAYGFAIAFLSFFYLGWTNDRFDLGKTLGINAAGTIIGGLIFGVLSYLDPPAFVGIWGGWFRILFFPMVFGSVILLLISLDSDGNGKGAAVQVIKLIALAIGILTVLFTPVFHWQDLYNIPQVTEIDNISQAKNVIGFIDANHPRIVDIDLAWSRGHTIISDGESSYGSIYEVRKKEFHMQKVKGHEFWVAPLEFQENYGKWDDKRTSPGFIMVDAEDSSKAAELYTGYDMKYLPSAYWSSYLPRYVYSLGYTNVKLGEPIFEVTDNLEPRWVISLLEPTINNDGYVVKSVLTIDPRTGDKQEYSLDKVPAWIDRVTPEDIAKDYATWKGKYVKGWWNANGPGLLVSGEGVNELTTTTTKGGDTQVMYFVTGTDEKSYWFSGMTSPSYSDQSLSSIVLIDSRNPTRMIRIRTTGANEQAALDALNSKFSQNPNWYGTAVIPYEVFGVFTYVIPFDAHTDTGNVFEGVGFVEASTRDAVIGRTKEEAAEAYKAFLADKNVKIALSSASGQSTIESTVVRKGMAISSGQSTILLWLNNSNIVFKVNPTLYPTASLTEVNDVVNISYIDTNDTAVGVKKFSNDMIKARIGKDQMEMDRQTANLTKQKEENWDVQREYQNKIDELRKSNQ